MTENPQDHAEEETEEAFVLEVHNEIVADLEEFEKIETKNSEDYDRYLGGPHTIYPVRVKLAQMQPFNLEFQSEEDRRKALSRLAWRKDKTVRIVRYRKYWYGIFRF